MSTLLIEPDLLTRQDVRVGRNGFIDGKAHGGFVVGLVTRDKNAADQTIWRATCGDIGSFSFTREGAVERVLDLWNMQEKARAYELMSR